MWSEISSNVARRKQFCFSLDLGGEKYLASHLRVCQSARVQRLFTCIVWYILNYLRNRKHVPCFYRVIETGVKVWGNEKFPNMDKDKIEVACTGKCTSYIKSKNPSSEPTSEKLEGHELMILTY